MLGQGQDTRDSGSGWDIRFLFTSRLYPPLQGESQPQFFFLSLNKTDSKSNGLMGKTSGRFPRWFSSVNQEPRPHILLKVYY